MPSVSPNSHVNVVEGRAVLSQVSVTHLIQTSPRSHTSPPTSEIRIHYPTGKKAEYLRGEIFLLPSPLLNISIVWSDPRFLGDHSR